MVPPVLSDLKKRFHWFSRGRRDWIRICSLTLLLLMVAWVSTQYWKWLYTGRRGIAFWQEAYVNGVERKAAEFQVAEYLRKNFDGKPILMDVSEHGMIPPRMGLSLRNIINETEFPRWDQALRAPETLVDWVVVQEDDSIWLLLENSQGFWKQFQIVFTATSPLEFPIHVFRRR
jgi:hypothetical protein